MSQCLLEDSNTEIKKKFPVHSNHHSYEMKSNFRSEMFCSDHFAKMSNAIIVRKKHNLLTLFMCRPLVRATFNDTRTNSLEPEDIVNPE